MAKTNIKVTAPQKKTAEGGAAFPHANAVQQLRRSVMSCLLWEDEFYVDGEEIASRIGKAAASVTAKQLADIAVEARTVANLRHVPLLLAAYLCKYGTGSGLVADTIAKVICRADELAEFVSIYAKVNGVAPNAVKKKLSAQAKKGLARAFRKFDEYQLAKYNRDGAVKLRDVLFLCHPKPENKAQEKLWKKLVEGKLATPDTWEVELSAGKDKKETFTRLIHEGKLGYLAVLRNLRNMSEAGVEPLTIKGALMDGKGKEKVLPFRYLAAARHAPQFEKELDASMQESIKYLPKLKGKTAILVDVSSSMEAKLSGKSELSREDAACALAAIINAEDAITYSFSGRGVMLIPPRNGMAMIDAIKASQTCSGTDITQAVDGANKKKYDRIIVITDEQSASRSIPQPLPGTKAYCINVASNKNGIGYGAWTHIDGFSENVLRFIYESEKD